MSYLQKFSFSRTDVMSRNLNFNKLQGNFQSRWSKGNALRNICLVLYQDLSQTVSLSPLNGILSAT